jgi:hypothetical protein
MHRANDPIVRAIMQDPDVLARFWRSVDRTSSEDGCWQWRDKPSCRYGYAVFRVRSHSISIARVAWFAATGEFPLAGRIRHTCSNVSCVCPQHLVWELGRMSERALIATCDGYASTAGITSAIQPSIDGGALRRAS